MEEEVRLCMFHKDMKTEQEKQWTAIGKRIPDSVIFWVIGGVGAVMGIAFIVLISIQSSIYEKVTSIDNCMAGIQVMVGNTKERLDEHLREWNRYRGRIEREIKPGKD